MLIEFSVGNYRSFKEKATLSMVAASLFSQPPSLDEHNVFEVESDLKLLTSATIYGANASGKSNFIAALNFMRSFIISSSRESQAGEAIPFEPFRLVVGCDELPSSFEIVFRIKDTQYRYGFEITAQRVVAERLYKLGSAREVRLFERSENDIKINTKSIREGNRLREVTRDNALFLSVLAQFNDKIATSILRWFTRIAINTGVNSDSRNEVSSAMRVFDNSPLRKSIEQLIRRIDVGIEDFSVVKTPYKSYIPENLPSDVAKSLTDLMELVAEDKSFLDFDKLSVKTHHRVFDSEGRFVENVIFDLEKHESAGTKRLFALAYPLLRALNTGDLLVVDEIDARVHPNLVIELVRLFNSRETNRHNAQIIFTTHNTNLLNAKLFRRDQIWFVEKTEYGASDLYSLVEYQSDGKRVRNDASFEKDYIAGRYGAVPFIGDLSQLLGEDLEQTTVAE